MAERDRSISLHDFRRRTSSSSGRQETRDDQGGSVGTGSQLARPQLGETLARPHDTQPGDTSQRPIDLTQNTNHDDNWELNRLLWNVVKFCDDGDGVDKAGMITGITSHDRIEIMSVTLEEGKVKTEFFATDWQTAHKLLRDAETGSKPELIFDPATGGPHINLANPHSKPLGAEDSTEHPNPRICKRGRTCKFAKQKRCRFEHSGRLIGRKFTLQR